MLSSRVMTNSPMPPCRSRAPEIELLEVFAAATRNPFKEGKPVRLAGQVHVADPAGCFSQGSIKLAKERVRMMLKVPATLKVRRCCGSAPWAALLAGVRGAASRCASVVDAWMQAVSKPARVELLQFDPYKRLL